MIIASTYDLCVKEKKRNKKLEKYLIETKSIYWSYLYARNVMKARWLEAEDLFKDHYSISFDYAVHVIKGRFQKGEDIIAADGQYSYNYAVDVLDDAFEKCHPMIFKTGWRNVYLDFLKNINYDLDKINEWLI